MLKNILVIFSLVAAAYGSGRMTILESPDAILFKKTDRLDGNQIGQVLSACTGHSISESVLLKVQFTSPFGLAEKVCLFNIEGVNELPPQNLKPKSEIDVYGTENSNEAFTSKLIEEGSSIVHVHLDDGLESLSALQSWCETPLKPENSKEFKTLKDDKTTESRQLLEAITVLSVLSEAKCELPAFLQFNLKLDSTSRDKSLATLTSYMESFGRNFQKNANGFGLVAILTSEEQQLKRSRRAVGDNDDDLNLAESYSEDYPVIFNIILWFFVLLAFSMLTICYAIGTMDPGRDSIIYRMTSTRIKKDN